MDGTDRTAESDTLDALSGLLSGTGVGGRLGDFTLLRRLGRGAQGDVYEARQESLGRLVALKILAPYLTLNPERVQRFRREAEAGGRLGHVNTVGVHAVGTCNGLHFIVQELVAGGRTLGDRIATARNEPELPRGWYETTAELFVQVADALHVAHEAGIIHRDVKPGNILITKTGVPKVADFGLAMVLDDLHRSLSGELIGTPFYMSPEQTSASRTGLDRRTDVFSLGVTLYEALTLQRPFDAENREGIVEQIRLHDPHEPRRLRASVPRELSVICMKAMEKRPERRYPSAGEMADELRRFLRHEPIRARPPGPVTRAAKWMRRHPVASATGSVTMAALVVVTALLIETSLARKRTEEAGQATATALQALKVALGEKEAALAEAQVNLQKATLAEFSHKAASDVMGEILLDNPVLLSHFGHRGKGWQLFLRSVDHTAEIAAQLGAYPDAQYGVVSLAGNVYCRLGLLDRAEPLLTQAAELAPTLPDEKDKPEGVATSLLQLGRLRSAQGRFDEADQLFEQALQMQDGRDSHSSVTLEILADLGTLHVESGRLDDAERELARLDVELQAAGRPIDKTLWWLEQTGRLRFEQGRLDEAEEKLRAVLTQSAAFLPDYEAAKAGLWLIEVRQAEAARATDETAKQAALDEVPRILEELLARNRQTYPDVNLETARLEMELGTSYCQSGRLDEARPLLEHALAVCLDLVGADDRLTLSVRNNLANLDWRDGRGEQAEQGWREIIASEDRSPQAKHAPLYSALKQLGDSAYYWHKDYDEAERLARRLVATAPSGDAKHAEGEAQLARIAVARAAAAEEEARAKLQPVSDSIP